jgi:NADH-quinone oxidoreductase subunit G
MINITIDGKIFEVVPGKNLLETCLALGFNVPYFCFHPAMGSVGACRLCAVKKYKDTNDNRGRIVMSCMEPVVDGLIISIEDPDVRDFRKSILESLMTNHPHDCPVCDEGGECHLQDMTVMTGHNYRRFNFKKRTHTNQYLGPFVTHEMNRCIQCYRCVRYYKDYAGGKDFEVFSAHDQVYFGRHEEGILESEFSGNLVEVCPTGVFTDKTLNKKYTRKWDLTNAPSICVNCSVGCNTIASERYGVLRRILSRYNGAVNGYFLCDRGRFGYEFVNDEKRIRKIQIRSSQHGILEEIANEDLTAIFLESKKLVGIGSPRASLEANFALATLVGKNNFYHGLAREDYNLAKTACEILKQGTVYSPSLKEIEKADCVLILGEDVTNTAPMIALALRKAARNKPTEMAIKMGVPSWHDSAVREITQDLKSPFFSISSYETKLDELCNENHHASSADIARLGYAVASILNKKAPAVKDLDQQQKDLVEKIAKTLKEAKNPVIISGTHSRSEEVLHAAANIAQALSTPDKRASLSLAVPECNSMGLAMMEGNSIDDVLKLVNEEAATLIILENDLYRRTDSHTVDQILEKFKQVIVLDYLENETTSKADVLLPAGTFAESEGTLVNNEGRAQRFYNTFPVQAPLKESWHWIRDIMKLAGRNEGNVWQHFGDVVSAMSKAIPAFSKIVDLNLAGEPVLLNEKIPRQTPRYSGRTSIKANISVSEDGPPQDFETPLAFSMEGYKGKPPSSLIPYYWSPGWNSYQAMNKYLDEPNGSLKGGDPGIRVFETAPVEINFYNHVPAVFESKQGQWQVVPVYHIFGSEELSSKGKAIGERIPERNVFINEEDLKSMNIAHGQTVQLDISGKILQLKIMVNNSFPKGVVGVSYNLPGMPFLNLPGWGKISSIPVEKPNPVATGL